MTPFDQLRFSVSDRIKGADVGPTHVPLALLGDFQKDVSEFLRGSGREIDAAEVCISIETGSLTFVVSGLPAATSLWSDLEQLKLATQLNFIDPKRAGVVTRWQSNAKQHPLRRYIVSDQTAKPLLAVDATSTFQRVDDAWVPVEKYLHGKIVDMGGKTKANVHLELENGVTVTIAAPRNLLAQGEQNRLYRPALLHVTAEESLLTRELRNLRLLAFETHEPSYDDEEFKRMMERGGKAWAEVPDPTAWLETLRGNET